MPDRNFSTIPDDCAASEVVESAALRERIDGTPWRWHLGRHRGRVHP